MSSFNLLDIIFSIFAIREIQNWEFNYLSLLGILILDMEANSFHAVVNRLVDEFGMDSDLPTEMKSGDNTILNQK